MKWSEREIARALALQFFQRKHLLVVPNCTWTGNETDLLLITQDLRTIDVEIKISRSDLKADAKKEKWFHGWDWAVDGHEPNWQKRQDNRRRREFPSKVWKHYYAMPAYIWTDELLPALGSPACGVLLLHETRNGDITIECRRRAMPNREAQKVSAEDAVNIARLASLRMWDAYSQLDAVKRREVAA